MLTDQERKEHAEFSKRKYYLKNLKACRERSRRWREEHRAEYQAYMHDYIRQPEVMEKSNARHRAYRATYQGKAAGRAYRIRRKKLVPELVRKQELKGSLLWKKRHPEAAKSQKQRSYIRRRDWLGGSYVRQMVVQNTPLSRRDCPAQLVAMKREQLKAWRVQHEIRCAMVEN